MDQPESRQSHRRAVLATLLIVAIPLALFVGSIVFQRDGALVDCDANDLHLSVQQTPRPDAPTSALVLRVRNDGEVCALVGAPTVELRDESGAWSRPSQDGPAQVDVDRWDAVLETGRVVSATAIVGTDDPTRYDAIRIRLTATSVERENLSLVIGTPIVVSAFEPDAGR